MHCEPAEFDTLAGMQAFTEWKQDGLYEGVAENGTRILFDTADGERQAPTPVEAVLMALCGCTSVDVVEILKKKRQPVTSLKVRAEADRAHDVPRVFTRIRLIYEIGGKVSRQAAEHAVSLSKDKYCTVGQMLSKVAPIEAEIVLLDGELGAE